MCIIMESDVESGLGLLVGSLERTEPVLEVKQRLVLLGLELGHVRGQHHGRDLPSQIELLVGIRGNHREYLVKNAIMLLIITNTQNTHYIKYVKCYNFLHSATMSYYL